MFTQFSQVISKLKKQICFGTGISFLLLMPSQGTSLKTSSSVQDVGNGFAKIIFEKINFRQLIISIAD